MYLRYCFFFQSQGSRWLHSKLPRPHIEWYLSLCQQFLLLGQQSVLPFQMTAMVFYFRNLQGSIEHEIIDFFSFPDIRDLQHQFTARKAFLAKRKIAFSRRVTCAENDSSQYPWSPYTTMEQTPKPWAGIKEPPPSKNTGEWRLGLLSIWQLSWFYGAGL